MKRSIGLAGLLIIITTLAFAQPSKSIQDFNLEDGLALDGYDPVAYFKERKAIEGKMSITAEHDGVRYRFSTDANKNLFLASPSAYLPQYGGWCAYAMGANGEKVDVDPETFKIVDGKLYLFYNRFFNNTLETWNKNETTLKTAADKNWSKLIKP